MSRRPRRILRRPAAGGRRGDRRRPRRGLAGSVRLLAAALAALAAIDAAGCGAPTGVAESAPPGPAPAPSPAVAPAGPAVAVPSATVAAAPATGPALATARPRSEDGLPPAPPPPAECYLGVVLASRTVEVVAEVAGRVLRIDAGPGDAVAAGDLLGVIDPGSTRHQLAIERAGVAAAELERQRFGLEVVQAEQELARARALEELVARQELERAALRVETAKAGHEIARAEVARAEARAAALADQLGRSEVRAPFAGTVALRHLDPGTAVTPGTPVVRLLGGGEPFVRFAVPPERAAALAAGAAVRVELEAGPPAALRGAVRRVSPEVDAATGMIFAEADLETAPSAGVAYPPRAAARVSLDRPGGAPACFERAPAPAGQAAGERSRLAGLRSDPSKGNRR